MQPPGDPVDTARAEWALVHPDLDTSPMAVARLRLAAAALARWAEEPVREEQLTRAEFDVLCAVRRAHRALTPTGIAAATLSSGAAATKRLEHLVRRGLLERHPDPRDGRVTRLSVTGAGREVVDRLLPAVLDTDRRFMAVLDEDQRAALDGALRVLLAPGRS